MTENTFATKQDVINHLDSVSWLGEDSPNKYSASGTYYERHGEYARPVYSARRYRDGWAVHVEYSFYVGTFNAPESGRLDDDSFVEMGRE